MKSICFATALFASLVMAGNWAAAVATTGDDKGEAIPVKVVSLCCSFEPVEDTGPTFNSLDRFLFEASGMLAPTGIYTNRSRIWRYLAEYENACTIRKRKNPQRAAAYYYSALPHSIFPANRLIMIAGNSNIPPGPIVDLETLLATTEARIGLIQVNDYGPVVDRARQLFPDRFFLFPTHAAVDITQIKALAAGRVDAIIGSSAAVMENIKDMEAAGNPVSLREGAVRIFEIEGSQPSLGYFVCPKTEAGQRIITVLDGTLARRDIQAVMLDLHKDWFPAEEGPFLQKMFQDIFSFDVAD